MQRLVVVHAVAEAFDAQHDGVQLQRIESPCRRDRPREREIAVNTTS
jgi:hypothetical protein